MTQTEMEPHWEAEKDWGNDGEACRQSLSRNSRFAHAAHRRRVGGWSLCPWK
jgi:hypothetical protein